MVRSGSDRSGQEVIILRKRISAWQILCVGLVLMLLAGCAKSTGTVKETFDLSELNDSGMPFGWSLLSFENQYEANCENGIVTLSSEIADDVRLVHTVGVESGTKYVLSAEIRTVNVIGGAGASLSIDNYSIDGSYIYSAGLHGNNDWTYVELAFETDRDQEAVQLALRMGGYSAVASGTVSYRNVSLVQTDTASVPFQKLKVSSSQSSTDSDKTAEEYEAFFSFLFWATIIVAAGLLFGIYRYRDRMMSARMDPKSKWIGFCILILIGFLIRLLLCKYFKGHATDMSCWIGWGNQIADGRWSTFYDGTWYDYPPGYMLILGLLTQIMRILRVSEWGSETLRLFWYMVPAFLCDIACGVLLIKFCEERKLPDGAGLLLGGLIVLNPAAVYLSGAWAQIDSILTLFLLLTYGALRKNRRILAGFLYAVAILIKWQALIYGPVLALIYIGTLLTAGDTKTTVRDILKTAAAVVLALAVIFLVSLPFRGSMDLLWIVRKFMSASSGYDYATVEGYNFLALLGLNWKNANLDLLGSGNLFSGLLQVTNAIGKLLLPIAAVALVKDSIDEFLNERGRAARIAMLTLLILSVALFVFGYAVPKSDSFIWTLYGVSALISLGGWIVQKAETQTIRATVMENETMRYALLTAVIACGLGAGIFSFWMVFRLVGATLTSKLFGTVMIVLAFAACVWMLYRYYLAGRLKTDDPEMIYLVSACFMLWVFTFGQYMHERYVFPVLILLLFAFAANGDRKILCAALLLTVTTFLNETVAMYVVSEGAINAIRGGETHNRFLMVCSIAETVSALYLTATVFLRMRGMEKRREQV